MAIHIQDPTVDMLVREFARREGLGVTAAVKLALNLALQDGGRRPEVLRAKIEGVIARVRVLRERHAGNQNKKPR